MKSTNPKEVEPEEQNHKGKKRGILSALVEVIRNIFGPILEYIEVEDVRIGLAYTGVLLFENYGKWPNTSSTSFPVTRLYVCLQLTQSLYFS